MDSSTTREKPPQARERPPSILSGIVLMCLGVMMFPLLNTCSKLLAGAEFPVLQIVWARFFGHLVVVSIAFLPRRGLQLFVAKQPMLQIGRSLMLLGSTVFFISAIGRVPLATATAIGFTTPLLVTALSVPLLRESVGPRRWAAVI